MDRVEETDVIIPAPDLKQKSVLIANPEDLPRPPTVEQGISLCTKGYLQHVPGSQVSLVARARTP